MKTNSNNQQTAGLDFVQPIVDIGVQLLELFQELLGRLIKYLIKRIFKGAPEEKTLTRNQLYCHKKTSDPAALGVDTATRKPLLLKDINFANHSFIVGASGFGKTNLISILQEHSLKRGIPVIFFDPKGDYEALTTFRNLCEAHKKTCRVFSEFDPQSEKFNPLLEGSVNQVAERIMSAFDWSEQYYRDVSYRALIQTLRDIESSSLPFTFAEIQERLPKRANEKDIAGLLAKIDGILSSDFAKNLDGSRSDFTLSKIREEGSCLYIGLSTQGYGETARGIGKLFLQELLFNSYFTLRDKNRCKTNLFSPLAVYFDEFGALVNPEFIELQNKCRGARMEITMAVQTPADIDRIDPTLTRQIIENASNLFILKQRLDDAATLFSNAIGTCDAKKMTQMTEDGRESSHGSMRDTKMFKSGPDIIKNLNTGQCILLRHNPERVQLINIRERKGTLSAK